MNLNEEFKKAFEEGYRYGDITMNSYGEIFIEFTTGYNGRGKYKEIKITLDEINNTHQKPYFSVATKK